MAAHTKLSTVDQVSGVDSRIECPAHGDAMGRSTCPAVIEPGANLALQEVEREVSASYLAARAVWEAVCGMAAKGKGTRWRRSRREYTMRMEPIRRPTGHGPSLGRRELLLGSVGAAAAWTQPSALGPIYMKPATKHER